MSEKLSKADEKKILSMMEEIKESSDELKMVAEMENSSVRDDEALRKSIAEEKKSEKVLVETNVLTGEIKNKGPVEKNISSIKKSAIKAEECLEEMPDSIDDIKISDDAIRAQLKEEINNISDEDILKLTNIIQRYRNKENFKVYNELPPKMKGLITKQLSENSIPFDKQVVEAASEALISNIISGIAIDQYQVEFDEAMGELLNEEMPEVTKYVVESIKTRVKVLRDKATELTEAGETDKAESITKVADACEDAYDFKSLLEALKSHKIKIKKFDIEKCEKVFRDFDYKYTDSPYKIRTVASIPAVLNRVLDVKAYRNEHLIAFTVAFCKLCMNYKPAIPEQHSFMYYTIQSIIYLDINSEDEEFNKFKDSVISKVKECLDIIDKDYNYLW